MIYGKRLTQLVREKRFVPYHLVAPYCYEVGATYWCGYWQEYYTVIEVDGRRVKVCWEDERETVHSTSLNPTLDYQLKKMEFTDIAISQNVSMTFAEIKSHLIMGEQFPEKILLDFKNRYLMCKARCPNDRVYYYLCFDKNAQKLFLNRDLIKSPRVPGAERG